MLLVRADHTHDALPPHDLALVTNPFDRCPDLHDVIPLDVFCSPLDASAAPSGDDLVKLELHPDETEFIEVRQFSFEQAPKMVLANEILDSMTVIAMLHAARTKGL